MIAREGTIGRVIEGRNGRLFVGNQGGFDVDRFISPRPLRASQTELWRRTLRRRARELKRRAIPYVFFLVPDAHFVCAEDFPEEMPLPRSAPGDHFLQEMAELRDIVFVDPRKALVDAKGLLEIYRKTDSHWSMYGSYVGYQVLARALEALVPMSHIRASDISFEFRPTFGDLGASVVPERLEAAPRLTLERNPFQNVYVNDGFRRNGCQQTFAPSAAPSRALFYRDSFFTFLAEYVARSFRDMLCVGSTSFFLDEVDRWKPHVVVSECGERRLSYYASDHRRDSFEDLFRADFASAKGRVAHKALMLLGEGLIAQALSEIAPLEAATDLDPDHAYALAQVYVAAGDFDRAATAIEVARGALPERTSFLSIEATIALARGDTAIALDRAERALALAPYNGYHHETYATILINCHAAAEARRHLDSTFAEIDDSGVLWYLSSLASRACGDDASASETIVQALTLDPSRLVALLDSLEPAP